jgi:disulfide bond formation protein DsbB
MFYSLAVSIIATVAMSGSLYFSEVMILYPCEFCWYQRILMYPLVAIGVYNYITDKQLYGLIGFMSGFGTVIAGYHSVIQRAGLETCSGVCSQIQYQLGGVLTIPNLALIAFGLIFSLTVVFYRTNTQE